MNQKIKTAIKLKYCFVYIHFSCYFLFKSLLNKKKKLFKRYILIIKKYRCSLENINNLFYF